MYNFFKKYSYYIACALIGVALGNAKIYADSHHFWMIYGSALLMVFTHAWKRD
jgi:hypothetical protein